MVTVEELVEKTGVSAETAEKILAAEAAFELWDLDEVPELKAVPFSCGIECCGVECYEVVGPRGCVTLSR